MQRIEPASRLVDAFAYEICREELIEVVFMFEWVVPLAVRHRPESNQQSITSGVLLIVPEHSHFRWISSTYGL